MATVSDEVRYAWAGGLFEGEGSISYQGPAGVYGRRSPKVGLGMKDRVTVERFVEAIGCGKIYTYPVRGVSGDPFYHWQTTTYKDFRKVIARLWPYLGDRRRTRITEALRVSMLPKGTPSKEALSEAGKKGAMQRWNKDIERGGYHR